MSQTRVHLGVVLTVVFLLCPCQVRAAVINWTGTAGGSWGDSANWSSNPVLPGAGDAAVANVNATQTIQAFGDFVVGSFLGSPTLGNANLDVAGGSITVSGSFDNHANTLLSSPGIPVGTLVLNGTSTMAGLQMNGGTIRGAGTLTVSGQATFSDTSIDGPGVTVLQGSSAIVGFGALQIVGGRTVENRGSFSAQGQIIFNEFSLNGMLSGLPRSGTFENSIGAVFNASQLSGVRATGGPSDQRPEYVFDNAGTFRKDTGLGFNETDISSFFKNTGLVDIQSGTLRLIGGSTSEGGRFTGAGTLKFGGSLTTHLLDAATTVSMANVEFQNGVTTLLGNYNVTGSTRLAGGSVNLLG